MSIEGNIIVDNNGHFNQWIIDDTTFKINMK